MKVHLLMKIARQVEGETIFLNVIKASADKSKIQQYLRENSTPATEEINCIGCFIELGVLEDVEVEDVNKQE